MRDLTDNGIRLEIQEAVLLFQMFRDGHLLAGTSGRRRTLASHVRNSARIAFRQICGKVHGSRHLVPAASLQILEAHASAIPALAVSVSAIRDLAAQDFQAR